MLLVDMECALGITGCFGARTADKPNEIPLERAPQSLGRRARDGLPYAEKRGGVVKFQLRRLSTAVPQVCPMVSHVEIGCSSSDVIHRWICITRLRRAPCAW